MALSKPYPLILGIIVLFCFARPALAFGAGNIAGISKVEGQNWRHGDIEDTLLKIAMARAVGGKRFDKMMVSRVYFGNWLRDYSQAIDVGTVKSISAEAIRLLLCVLGFLSFGYGSREFEVTADRLGCYRPEDHIDNPKDYADNIDARQYDRRLRGPVNERVELAIDPQTGMKNYIANERVNIMTSAKHVRNLFTNCIELGRKYRRNKNKTDLYEALRLMGTGLHCLEDFLAHSNYTELALIELGERDIFPHVGRRTQIRLGNKEVYPIVTGTFGGVDFLHSVAGEVSDKLTQNEIEELEGTLQESKYSDTSILENLLDKIPDGLFGGSDKKNQVQEIKQNANSAQLQNMSVSPREPEEYTRYIQQIFKQVMPAIELHDSILQGISEAIEHIPVLPKIIEQLEDQLSVFVFSIIAPFVVPVINQIKNELRTGSAEIIQSSESEQHVVFDKDNSSDPTHSMLSKDHFSNVLNEPAGRTATKVVEWVVPQLMNAWDDDNVNVGELMDTIVHGVLHHPAQRDQADGNARKGRALMFSTVEEWWNDKSSREKSDLRNKLSRDGVFRGENHKEGVQDTGHGCCGKLKMHKQFGGNTDPTTEDKIASAAAGAIIGGMTSGISSIVEGQTGFKIPTPQSEKQESSGGLGGFLSKLIGGGLKSEDETEYHSSGRTNDGGYQETTTAYGRNDNKYGQVEKTETSYASGSHRSEYKEYEQEESHSGYGGRQQQGHSYEERTDTRPTHGGGYEQRIERTWESNDGEIRRQEETHSYGGSRQEETSSYGGGHRQQEETTSHSGRHHKEKRSSDYGGGEQQYGGRQEQQQFGGRQEYGRQEEQQFGGGQEYGRQEQQQYGGRQEYGRQEQQQFGGGQEYGRQEYGRQEYGRQEQQQFGGGQEYGRQEQQQYGGRQEYGGQEYGGQEYGRQEQQQFGGRQEYGGQEQRHGGRRDFGGDEQEYGEREEQEYGRQQHQGGRGGHGGGEQEFSDHSSRREEENDFGGSDGGDDNNILEDIANQAAQALGGGNEGGGWADEVLEEGSGYGERLGDETHDEGLDYGERRDDEVAEEGLDYSERRDDEAQAPDETFEDGERREYEVPEEEPEYSEPRDMEAFEEEPEYDERREDEGQGGWGF